MVIYFVSEMTKEIGAACTGVAIGSTHFKVLMYADDAVIISDNAKDPPIRAWCRAAFCGPAELRVFA